jgi:hypothetical protein
MLIKTKTPGLFISDMDYKTGWHRGSSHDTHETTYLEDVKPIQQKVDMLKRTGENGFTDDRSMQQIGLIPITIWVAHPEFLEDPRSIDKWLKSEEGAPYRIAKGI